MEALLTAKEVARILKLTVRSVYRLQREGRIPASFRIAPSTSRWNAAEVAAFVKNAPRFEAKSAD